MGDSPRRQVMRSHTIESMSMIALICPARSDGAPDGVGRVNDSHTASRVAILVVALALVLAGCGSPPTGQPQDGGTPVPVARLEFGPASGSVPVGATVAMTARAFDADDNELTGVTFAFGSSAPGVIRIGADGVGEALTVGTATLSVRVGLLQRQATLNVTPASAAQPGLSWGSVTPQQFEALRAFDMVGARGFAVVGDRGADSGPGVALLRSDDAGQTWRPLYPPDLYDLTECPWYSAFTWVRIDPDDPDHVYASCGDQVLRSVDGGLRWSLLPIAGSAAPEFHPADPSFVTVGSTHHSFDRGATWSASAVVGSRWVSPTDSRHWVDRQAASATRVSTDAGATWRAVTDVPPPADAGCSVTSEGTVGVGGDGRMLVAVAHTCSGTATTSVYASGDDGLSWATVVVLAGTQHTVLGTALRTGDFVFSPVDPAVVYAVRANVSASAPLWVSLDGGASWTERTVPATASRASFVPGAVEAGAVALRSTAGASYEYYVSHDYGATWTATGIRGQAAQLLQRGPGIVYAFGYTVQDGREVPVRVSTDDLRTSAPLESAAGLTSTAGYPSAVSLTDAGHLRSWANVDRFCGLSIYQALGLVGLGSLDRGLTWSATETPALHAAQSPARPDRWYFATNKGGIRRSDDGGATYDLAGTLPYSAIALMLAPSYTDPDRVYALTENGVYRSVDAGVTWTWASDGISSVGQADLAIDPTDDRVLYVGGPSGVQKSTDAGVSWRETSAGLRDQAVSALALTPDGTTVFAGTCDGSVYRSLDAAGTWERVTSGFRSYRVSDLVIDPSDANVVIAATVGGVYRSTDKGSSWRLASTGMHSPFARWLAISTDGGTVYVGSADHGVYRGVPSGETGASFDTASVEALVERAVLR